jgi:TetR/AcrR family transcriptional regulator
MDYDVSSARPLSRTGRDRPPAPMQRPPDNAQALVPHGSDPVDSRTVIMDAAESLFARHGYAATTVKQIARASDRNTALIHYYFRSKEGLYKEVLRRAAGQLVGRVGAGLATSDSPEQAIHRLVQGQLAVFRATPHLLSLMVREMTDWGAAHAEDAVHEIAATIFRRVCDFIAEGQARGIFRTSVDPRFAALSLVAQVNWLLIARPAVGMLLGRGLGGLTESDLDAFAAHAAEFALAALRASPNQAPPGTAGSAGPVNPNSSEQPR